MAGAQLAMRDVQGSRPPGPPYLCPSESICLDKGPDVYMQCILHPSGSSGESSRQRHNAAQTLQESQSFDNRPIGVFDSGVGGLTVVRALQALLPNERIVYLGDTARVPYGLRSPEVVRRYAGGCAGFLLQQRAKMVVVACNTASAHALDMLEGSLPVPVLGVIEAGAREVSAHLSQGSVGVMATEGTVASDAYPRALATLAPQLQVSQIACPMFVPLCEEGLMDHPATRLLAQSYVDQLAAAARDAGGGNHLRGLSERGGLDGLILGCTHYPLLQTLLQQLVGPGVKIFDSATAVAHSVARCLTDLRLNAQPGASAANVGALTLYATDVPARLKRVAQTFLGSAVPEVHRVDLA